MGRMEGKGKNTKKEVSVDLHDAHDTLLKEEWSDKFKSFLASPSDEARDQLGLIRAVGGEKVEESNRDRIIILSSIYKFIDLPDFPKDKRNQIRQNLNMMGHNDPHTESVQYYGEHDSLQKKNRYAENYNKKMERYIEEFKEVIHSLSDFLPVRTINNLLDRAKKFSDPVMKMEDGLN